MRRRVDDRGPQIRADFPCQMMIPLALLFAGSSAWADQSDPRLTQLFDRLSSTTDQRSAQRLEQEIWDIWAEAPNTSAKQLFYTARAALNARSLPAAKEVLDRLIETEPNFSEAWNQRAIVSFLLRDYEASMKDIEQTLALEPRHFGALSGRGQCYIELDKPQEAVSSFERALQLNPWLPSARMQLEMLREYMASAPRAI